MSKGAGALGDFNTADLSTLEEEAQGFDVAQDVTAYANGRGLISPRKPDGFNGEMPDDITAMDDDELGDHLNKMSQYIGWVEHELALAQLKMETALAQYEYKYSRVRLHIKATIETKLTDKDRTDYVIGSPAVKAAKEKIIFSESFYRITRNIRDQAQRNWDTISRRITQRGQEIERMKREGSVAGVPAYNPHRFNRPGHQ